VPMHNMVMEARIKILAGKKLHLVVYIALQLREMDDKCLQNDVNAY